MSPENKKRVQEVVACAGDELKGKLPPVDGLAVRNPYAHVWKAIKEHFGVSYKELDDSKIDEVLALIEACRNDAIEDVTASK